MAEYTGDDVTHSQQVRHFIGGVQKTENITTDGTDETNGYIALEGKAEYGSVQLLVDGVLTGVDQFSDAAGTEAATDDSGVQSIKYTGLVADQALVIYYLDIGTTPLSEVAVSKGVTTDWTANEITEEVDGQANQITVTGATRQTATLNSLVYNQDLPKAFQGDQVIDSSSNKLWTTKQTAFRKVGAMVSKKTDASGNLVYKYFFYGCTPTGRNLDLGTGVIYKNSFTMNVDDHAEFEVSA
jgi:hypothetical protein